MKKFQLIPSEVFFFFCIMKFLKDNDKAIVKEIDKNVKNKWSWRWSENEVTRDVPRLGRSVTYKIKDCISKIDEPGFAFCTWCRDKIAYGSEGKKAIDKHVNRAKHVKEFSVRATNYQLSSSVSSQSSTSSSHSQGPKNFPIFKNVIAQERQSFQTESSAPKGNKLMKVFWLMCV